MIIILAKYNLEKLISEIFDEVMVRIKNLYTQSIIVFGSDSITDIEKYNYNIVDFRASEGNEKILITELTNKMLSSLANLNFSDENEEFILGSILAGREIYILKDNIEYKQYKNLSSEIYRRYFSYETLLKSYNVKFIKNISEMKRTILVDVENISRYVVGEKIILHKNMILTAAAKDYISTNRLILERR